MKIERTKNASRNIIYGTILKMYQIVVPFIMRTAMIYLLGIEYLGLNSLFTSVLQVLNLAELGIGSAMVFSMYKPIADDNKEKICALMHLYKIYYRVIGIVIFVSGLFLLPFIPKLIKGEVPPDINIYILYLMNLGATVLSYWLFAYKNSILQAYQRMDVISKVTIVTETCKYILQLGTLFIFKNYYYYVIIILLTQIMTNVLTAIASDKMYPQYKAIGKLTKDEISIINKRIRDLFTSKVGSVIVNSTGSIVISSFLGLTVLAIYQNYFYLLTAVIGIVTVVFISCTAGIGNSLIVESMEKNYKDLEKFTLIMAWIAGFCTCCFLCLFQPFMELWVGKKNMLDFSAVICLCIYYFVYEINQLLNTYKDAAGLWHEDRFRPLVTALVNLGLSIFLVNKIGIYGVLISTVLSMLVIGMPWLIYNLFSVLFKRNPVPYLKKMILYCLVTICVCISAYYICEMLTYGGILGLIMRLFVCTILTNIVFFIFYHRMWEFLQVKQLAFKIVNSKFKIAK